MTYDEPLFRLATKGEHFEQENNRLVKSLVDAHNAIRRWEDNPNHLVFLTFNLAPSIDQRNWHNFLPACQAMMIDRYPIVRQFEFFLKGDWGAVRCPWQIAHGTASILDTDHRRPTVVM